MSIKFNTYLWKDRLLIKLKEYNIIKQFQYLKQSITDFYH